VFAWGLDKQKGLSKKEFANKIVALEPKNSMMRA
jgi:hypothetical protein